MKFGKHIQAEQVPGWSRYYLDYKALKKIISSIGSRRSATEGVLDFNLRAGTSISSSIIYPSYAQDPNEVPLLASLGQDDERGADFQAVKAAFFFKLERELEKINAFYLEKEAELKLRLETLLSKRRAAAMHVLPEAMDDNSVQNHVEWNAVQEGFRLLERDLGKLQQFVEINATGFRKILKKWDKRSKSSTRELYLARQVDVQPVFNRQLIAELSDTVAACLLDFTDLTVGLKYEGHAEEEAILKHQLNVDRSSQMGPFRDLESNLRKAIADNDSTAIRDLVRYSDSLSQTPEAKMHVTRILWKTVIDAPPPLADLILSSTAGGFNYAFVDDINGRTCLHEASIVGEFRLVNLCLENGVQRDKIDIYGRSALHYAAMYGHVDVSRRLIEVGLPVDVPDFDNCTPIIYATLRGSVGCVQVLLEVGNVSAQTSVLNGDLMPLSLAARAGHLDVVVLLLQHNAPSIPNTNGEYPMHLAAQEGHAGVCRLLARHEGWDVPDKYNEWTPLFHAARYGHDGCLKVLLEVGARIDRSDELGNSAAYYAAWYGHLSCVSLLMEAAAARVTVFPPSSHISPLSDAQMSTGTESDIDAIPSLYLPPPMMPYRVYGHNYLDRSTLVQVSIGHLSSKFGDISAEPSSAVRLRSSLGGSEFADRYLHTSPRLKLVMTPTAVATAPPYSIPLPLTDEKTVFTFQIPSVDVLSLEFSLYPNFGTKTIGRAIALPPFFSQIQNNQAFILPIIDHRLHVMGEVSFEVNVITPFSGVRLEIGGAVETYWKSIANPVPNQPRTTPRPGRHVSSAQNSPLTFPLTPIGSHSLTHSSVIGSYVHITVQVTRDLHPVIYPDWILPETGYDLGVSDLTFSQFQALAARLGRGLGNMEAEFLKILPPTLGVCIEVAYPPSRTRQQHSLRHRLELNDVVDSVLRTIYDITTKEGPASRRSVVFTSFAPDVCSALNWKQPNYPVFFASHCGLSSPKPLSPTSLSVGDAHDYRLSSLGAAVEWCKLNNLLGLLLDAELLHKVPALIQGVKDFGLLVGAFGGSEHMSNLSIHDSFAVDAYLQDGILTFYDYTRRL
ncbi:Peroxisome assembly protein 12 [Abortiporus biennis]